MDEVGALFNKPSRYVMTTTTAARNRFNISPAFIAWMGLIGVLLVVGLVPDDAGGYLIIKDSGQGGCPGLADYPSGSACADLAQPPPGWTTCSRGVGYGEVLYQWYTFGQPADWDTDGDGRPCEDAYPYDSSFTGEVRLLRP